jgi:aquaporin Z
MKENLKKYFVELIGAFFLMFTVASAVMLAGDGVIPAISIGFVLMVLVYAGGHVSGGHYNPAVSLAAAIRGALEWKQLIPYWIAQFAGGAAAAYLALQFAKVPAAACVGCSCPFTIPQVVVGEFLFTFLLCWVVLHVATSKGTEGNSFYGLAIGSTVTVGAFAVGGILCFGAFNPAVALGLGLLGKACWCCVGLTVVVNLVAAIAAGIVYKMTEIE